MKREIVLKVKKVLAAILIAAWVIGLPKCVAGGLSSAIGKVLAASLLLLLPAYFLLREPKRKKAADKTLDFQTPFIEVVYFVDFVKNYGPNTAIASHINHKDNSEFSTLEISNEVGRTVSVRFHASLGELSVEKLRSLKENLYVGKDPKDGRWYLFDNNFRETKKWEDVDLGL